MTTFSLYQKIKAFIISVTIISEKSASPPVYLTIQSESVLKRDEVALHETKQVDVVYTVRFSLFLHACTGEWEVFKFRAVKIVTFRPQHD